LSQSSNKKKNNECNHLKTKGKKKIILAQEWVLTGVAYSANRKTKLGQKKEKFFSGSEEKEGNPASEGKGFGMVSPEENRKLIVLYQ